MSAPKLRGKSVSKDQKLLMVELMEENVDLANDRFDSSNGKENNREQWRQIADKLNSLVGANKDSEKWRRAWIDMKKYTRGQWSLLKEYDNRTGLGMEGHSKRPNQLSPLDERILNVIRKEACEGTGNVEGGIELPCLQVTPTGSNISGAAQETSAHNLETACNPEETTRSIRTKRIRGSAYTRDKILQQSNDLEKNKIVALNRIAAAMEEKNVILKELFKNNNYDNSGTNNTSTEYLETIFLEED